MKRALDLMFLTGLMALLAGCAAKGPIFSGFQPVADGQAQVIVFRPDLFRAGGESVNIAFDKKPRGVLKNAGWLLISTGPGTHVLELDEGMFSVRKALQIPMTLESRERKVFRVLPGGMTGAFPLPTGPVLVFGPWTVLEVKEQDVASEIASLRQSE